MKKIYLILSIFLFSSALFSQGLLSPYPNKPNNICSDWGNAKNSKDSIANRYKNRDILVNQPIDTSVTLGKMLAKGEDSKRFNNNSYVKITGYLVEVQDGGKESCNCGTDNDSLKDIHIYIGQTPTSPKSECVIAEITHKWKKINKIYTLKDFKAKGFVGQKVNVYGYLFYDAEHKGSAVNTCKVCANTWRATCWEAAHPVCKIELTPIKK